MAMGVRVDILSRVPAMSCEGHWRHKTGPNELFIYGNITIIHSIWSKSYNELAITSLPVSISAVKKSIESCNYISSGKLKPENGKWILTDISLAPVGSY